MPEKLGHSRRRLTGRVLGDLGVAMTGLGLVIGLVFPAFSVMLGVPTDVGYSARFVVTCVLAGLTVGGISWVITLRVVGGRMGRLTQRLATVSSRLRSSGDVGWSLDSVRGMRLAEDSADELGTAAAAFNELLDALVDEHQFRSLFLSSGDIITVVEPDHAIRFMSPSVRTHLGYAPERLKGSFLRDLVHPQDGAVLDAYLAALRPGQDDAGQAVRTRVRHSDGTWRTVETVGVHLLDDPEVGGLVLTSRDVTDRDRLERTVAWQSLHDLLTGLPNRAFLEDQVEQTLVSAAPAATSTAVLLLDLNRFKQINDTLGHTYGDALLTEIGRRLREVVPEQYTAARFGADEFAVLAGDLSGVEHAWVVAERIRSSLERPYVIEGLSLDVEVSVGVALAPEHALDAAGLLRCADVALNVAKQERAGVRLYNAADDEHTRESLALLGELRRGLDQPGEVFLHYQPKFGVPLGDLVGVEALVRWHHPTRGLVPPGDFISVAEGTGLIHRLTEHVLDLALAQVRTWADDGHDVAVAVNLSTRCLLDPALPDRVFQLLARHGVPARRLRLEITEGALITDPSRALAVLQKLRGHGIGLSVDDFGTGYSSMSYLQSLPVDELKIDRSFVTHMLQGNSQALVKSVVDLAHNLGLTVVAEGVEDALTLDALGVLGCDVVQGYHLSRPVPAGELTAILQAATAH